MINRQMTGVSRGAIPAPIPKPRLSIVQTISVETGTSASWFNFEQSGDYVYGAKGSGDIAVIDVSTPSSASIVETGSVPDGCRDIAISGTTLAVVSRGATNGTLTTWDISTPTAISLLDTYTGVDEKYSAIVMDGTTGYLAGQVSGAHKFDLSVPGTIPAPTSNIDKEPVDWETQGDAESGLYVFFANYNIGLRILDKATMVTTDNTVPAPSLNGQNLRIWECVIEGTWLYACTNVTNASGNAIERGLVMLDITDPTAAMTADDWLIFPVGADDVDTWINAGDKPILGITRYSDYIFLTNGQKGIPVFHSPRGNQSKVTYLGLLKGHDLGDNLNGIGTFVISGKTYLIFGDGDRAATTDGTDKLYIGEVTI